MNHIEKLKVLLSKKPEGWQSQAKRLLRAINQEERKDKDLVYQGTERLGRPSRKGHALDMPRPVIESNR